jgi:N-acylneuraminate cytidylyltransferase
VEAVTYGLEQLKLSGKDFAFSVARFPYPIHRALKLTRSGGVKMFHEEHRQARTQDLEPAYHDAGQFYWGRCQAFLDDRDTFSDSAVAIVLSRWRVVDIDDQEDWIRAEMLFRVSECFPQ